VTLQPSAGACTLLTGSSTLLHFFANNVRTISLSYHLSILCKVVAIACTTVVKRPTGRRQLGVTLFLMAVWYRLEVCATTRTRSGGKTSYGFALLERDSNKLVMLGRRMQGSRMQPTTI
jgi:hypothetical protein